MRVDYYRVLQVDSTANDDDLKRAYRKLAMKWHPDKNPSNKTRAEAEFKRISEAYDVLSDPHKRAVYDHNDEEQLKAQAPPPHSGEYSGFSYTKKDFDDIFAELFGSSNPFGEFDDDLLKARRSSGQGEGCTAARKAAPIEQELSCSLEELYSGSRKKMKISRDAFDCFGKTVTKHEILTIDVKPGWKKGTKITFEEKGHEQRGTIPADVIFTVVEKDHSVFQRESNDLVMTQKITLAEALTGYTAQVTTIDGRTLKIPIEKVINPSYEEVVEGEGMPLPRDPTKRGNLRIKFIINFPSMLTQEQKNGVKRFL